MWEKAKSEARRILVATARAQTTIFYSALCLRIKSMYFDPHGTPLRQLLDEISRSEHAAGRGLLSVVVVKKAGEDRGMPGQGFFNMAKELGRPGRDKLEIWSNELNFVYNIHSGS